jgi:hypothetical protein
LFWKAFLAGQWLHYSSQAQIDLNPLAGLLITTLTIYARSCFRVAELWGGFHSSLANNQIVFMIPEGAMLLIATTCQTVFHPHYAFQGSWHGTNFGMGKEKPNKSHDADSFELLDKSNTSSASVLARMY